MNKQAKSPLWFNDDYYQKGLESGKSSYQLYRWLPEATIPMVMRIIDYLHIRPEHKILDYGCAFGYVVKAFRMLNRQAWGVDISPYAIENVDPSVKDFCFLLEGNALLPDNIDFCIAKDVLEHIDYEKVGTVLQSIKASTIFAIVPLGNENRYYSQCNHLDDSHIICEDSDWWINTFLINGWDMINFTYRIDGIKESHYQSHPKAHGFLWCKRDLK